MFQTSLCTLGGFDVFLFSVENERIIAGVGL